MPVELRPAISAVLADLVAGRIPEMLTWVDEYGDQGATLVNQPEELWTHEWTDAVRTNDGGWHVVLPLWTTDESPSDLSAEVIVDPAGAVVLHDVHVL